MPESTEGLFMSLPRRTEVSLHEEAGDRQPTGRPESCSLLRGRSTLRWRCFLKSHLRSQNHMDKNYDYYHIFCHAPDQSIIIWHFTKDMPMENSLLNNISTKCSLKIKVNTLINKIPTNFHKLEHLISTDCCVRIYFNISLHFTLLHIFIIKRIKNINNGMLVSSGTFMVA